MNEAVQSRSVSKISEILKKATFSIGLTMDCVIRMKLVIPIFHTEFDALKVSNNRFGEIPPYGDFGDFWWRFWRFSPKRPVFKFNDIPFRRAHGVRKKMA